MWNRLSEWPKPIQTHSNWVKWATCIPNLLGQANDPKVNWVKKDPWASKPKSITQVPVHLHPQSNSNFAHKKSNHTVKFNQFNPKLQLFPNIQNYKKRTMYITIFIYNLNLISISNTKSIGIILQPESNSKLSKWINRIKILT